MVATIHDPNRNLNPNHNRTILNIHTIHTTNQAITLNPNPNLNLNPNLNHSPNRIPRMKMMLPTMMRTLTKGMTNNPLLQSPVRQ